ncbi:MAG: hypothetical protein RJA70_2907 [Pseudomonadota bacterium]
MNPSIIRDNAPPIPERLRASTLQPPSFSLSAAGISQNSERTVGDDTLGALRLALAGGVTDALALLTLGRCACIPAYRGGLD